MKRWMITVFIALVMVSSGGTLLALDDAKRPAATEIGMLDIALGWLGDWWQEVWEGLSSVAQAPMESAAIEAAVPSEEDQVNPLAEESADESDDPPTGWVFPGVDPNG